MTKFKVGDKVRYTLGYDVCGMSRGMISTVESMNGWLKLVNNNRGYWNQNCFELVEAASSYGKPHKHAELIKAWADGAEIEYKGRDGNWYQTDRPIWDVNIEYRVKPKKADPISYEADFTIPNTDLKHVKIKIIWDGDTKECISVEKL